MELVWVFDEASRKRVCRRKDGSVYPIASGKRCRKGSEDYTAGQRIKDLSAERDRMGQRLMKYMLGKNPDGTARIENPDEKASKLIDAVGERIKKIDRELNTLEGKNPDRRRWVDDDRFGLSKFSDWRSPGRDKFEKRIMEAELKDAEKGNKALSLMGGPASGKSTMLSRLYPGGTKGYYVSNPDNIKEALPEYKIGVALGLRSAAAIAHENSSRMSKEILKEALDRKVNILLDVTGSNKVKFENQLKDLKSRGYQLELAMQHVPQAVGVKRAMSRADRTGRYVPKEFIEEAYSAIPRNFFSAAKIADKATLNNSATNNVIAEFRKGEFVSGDNRAWSQFKRKYS